MRIVRNQSRVKKTLPHDFEPWVIRDQFQLRDRIWIRKSRKDLQEKLLEHSNYHNILSIPQKERETWLSRPKRACKSLASWSFKFFKEMKISRNNPPWSFPMKEKAMGTRKEERLKILNLLLLEEHHQVTVL